VVATILTQAIETGQLLLSDTKPPPLAMSHFRKKISCKDHSFATLILYSCSHPSGLLRQFFDAVFLFKRRKIIFMRAKGGETVH
jgi:hypothetical protein